MADLYEGYVTVRRLPAPAMVLLRADLRAAAVKNAVRAAAGVPVPPQRRLEMADETGAAWMGPDELLLFGPAGQGPAMAAALAAALAGQHALAADVSDQRALWQLEGAAVREVLAKLTPADIRRLPLNELRRTRLAQVAAALWLPDPAQARVLAFRSVAGYVDALLAHAARPGSEVG
jgi:sarcosine oxidase subunit gamma